MYKCLDIGMSFVHIVDLVAMISFLSQVAFIHVLVDKDLLLIVHLVWYRNISSKAMQILSCVMYIEMLS